MLAPMWSASLAGCGNSSEPELELRAGAAAWDSPVKAYHAGSWLSFAVFLSFEATLLCLCSLFPGA